MMRKLWVVLVLLTAWFGVWADESAGKMTILVAGQTATEPQAKAIFDELVRLQDASHVDKTHLPVVLHGVNELPPGDPERLGLEAKDLPWVCILSPSGKVVLGPGGVPAMVRSARHPAFAADLMFARWAQLSRTPVSPDLQLLADAFTPGKRVLLVAARTTPEASRIADPLRRLCSDNHITQQQLPILVTGTDSAALLDGEDFQRLGFGEDSLPCVCLIQMTEPPANNADKYFEAGHPGHVVNDVILRNVGNAESAANRVLQAWATMTRTPLVGQSPAGPATAADATPEAIETIVESGPAASPATPPPTLATGVVPPAGSSLVPDGTEVRLTTRDVMDFATAVKDTVLHFEVAEDVRAGTRVVIRKGAPSEGLITLTPQGQLTIVVLFVQMADDTKAHVRCTPDKHGAGHQVTDTGVTLQLRDGEIDLADSAEVPIGSEFDIYIDGDVTVR